MGENISVIPVFKWDHRRIVEKCDRCGAQFRRIPMVDADVYCSSCGPIVIDTNSLPVTVAA